MNTLTQAEVKAIRDAQAKRYTGVDVEKATRVEVHAALQLKNPPPYSDHPKHLPKDRPGAFTLEEREEIQKHQRAQVTDAEHIDFSKNRSKQPHVLDGHHWAQMKHGIALWEETNRLLKGGS